MKQHQFPCISKPAEGHMFAQHYNAEVGIPPLKGKKIKPLERNQEKLEQAEQISGSPFSNSEEFIKKIKFYLKFKNLSKTLNS